MTRICLSELVFALQIAEASCGNKRIVSVKHVTHGYTPCLDIRLDDNGEESVVTVELEKND